MGFGNSPAGDMTGMIPGGTTPHIVNVRYAGTYPLQHGVTNPPLTTPQFPSNPPRASSTAPVAAHPVNDQLTLQRPTHTMLGSLAAGGYKGSVGQVVRGSDPNSGARLRGAMLAGRLAAGGLGTTPSAPAPTTMAITAGNTASIERVATFSLPSNPYVSATMEGTTLRLTGKTAGQAQLQYAPVTGGSIVLQINVTGLSLPQAGQLIAKTAVDMEAAIGEPVLKHDWQDAEVLRQTYSATYSLLRSIYATARDLPGYAPQEYQALFLMRVLDTAKAHPETETLYEVLRLMLPAGVPASLTPAGRECHRNSVSGVVFHDLYTFARDSDFAFDVLEATAIGIAAIAGAVASIASLGAAAAAIAAVAATVAAVSSAAIAYVPAYKSDPKRLVADFGNAVCAALQGALPQRMRIALSLRSYVTQKEPVFRLARMIYDDPRTTPTAKASALRSMQTLASEAQAKLVKLQTLDQPQFFAKNPTENAKFLRGKATFGPLNVAAPELSGRGDQTPPAGPPVAPPGTPGAKSSKTPLLIGGGVVLALGAFFLLR